MGNSWGKLFTVTTFGESHGAGLGCIIDGCPSGISFDQDFLQHEMDRRKPGAKSAAVTNRKEADQAEVLSGIFEEKTTGTSLTQSHINTPQFWEHQNSLQLTQVHLT